jgi:ABC-type Fe3+/spermidine/putrescine transport system ATPase subunit
LDNISVVFEQGTFWAIQGASGSGKSTLLNVLGCLDRPTSGQYLLQGRDISQLNDDEQSEIRLRSIGFIFQSFNLIQQSTVEENIELPLYYQGWAPEASSSRARELAALVGLDTRLTHRPMELSGGQQQRVALARALAADPAVILLDEPFSNLDASLRDRMRRQLREILRSAGVTSIFVTHDQEEALSIADTVAVMRDGAIEQVGTPEEVYGRPSTRWVAEFLGEADILPAIAHGGWVECELGKLAVDPGFRGPADVIVRPESFAVGAGPSPRDTDASDAIVIERDFYGHDQLLELEIASGIRVRSRRPGYPAWHPGDRVRVWIEGPVTVLPSRTEASAQ